MKVVMVKEALSPITFRLTLFEIRQEGDERFTGFKGQKFPWLWSGSVHGPTEFIDAVAKSLIKDGLAEWEEK